MVKQGIDFAGLQNGLIHPTDIDAVLEFDNEALVLIEIKRDGNPIPTGQRLLLERLCNSWHTGKAVVIFATHKHYDELTDVPIAECVVKGLYHDKKWYKMNDSLVSTLNNLGTKWNINKLKF